jgi:hypothetical protein
MATAHPPDKLAFNTFAISMIGIALWIAAAYVFVLLD